MKTFFTMDNVDVDHIVKCCLLMPYSAEKSVSFSPFSNLKIIDCLSFIERKDHLRFKIHNDRKQTFVTLYYKIGTREKVRIIEKSG